MSQNVTKVDNSLITTYLTYLANLRFLEDKIPNGEALKRAVSEINNCGFQIYNGDQASVIQGVGTKTKNYIDGILNNRDPSKCGINDIDQLTRDQQVRLVTITEMDKIPDIGIKRAAMYYDAGYTNVDMLKDFLKVNGSQRTQSSLKYESQLEQRIPRAKIDKFISIFQLALTEFNNLTSSFLNFNFGGSYYRGENDSGDIDIIIWSFVPRESVTKQENFLEYLRQKHILLDTQVSGSVVYQGFAYIDDEFSSVRIDIKNLPDLSNYHYAMMHLIGPGTFNTRMSDLARSKGLTLGSNGMIINSTKESIYVRDQNDIFIILDQQYIEPKDRK